MSDSGAQLRDEIALREASMNDVAREVAAGEISEESAAEIVVRERAALEVARSRLAALTPTTPSPPPTPRRRRRWLLVTALACFVAAAGVLLWNSLAPRQPGTSITGSLSLSRAEQVNQLLIEAQADVANANPVAALSAYRQVLAIDAKNVTALTQSGWLEFSAGSASTSPTLVQLGVRELRDAIALDPHAAAPRLYYAIVAYSTPGNGALARRELEVFLSLHPSRGQLAIAHPLLVHFKLPTT